MEAIAQIPAADTISAHPLSRRRRRPLILHRRRSIALRRRRLA
jgi:hypothetical protein